MGYLGNRKTQVVDCGISLQLWTHPVGEPTQTAYLSVMPKPAIIALLLALIACTPQSRLYTGSVQPLAGTCDPPRRAELTLQGTAILFTPASATLILRGRRMGNTLSASATFSGLDHKPYTLAFQGELNGNTVAGHYQTPRCRYAVTLHATAE